MNTGIPFKQSISCIILFWAHTSLRRSSFFSAQAQTGKRSEHSSYTPILLNSSSKTEKKSKQGVVTLVGCAFGQSLSIVISSVLSTPCALLSLIHSFSTLWTLNRKNCILGLEQSDEYHLNPKFLLWSITCSTIRRLPVLVASSPPLHCPSCEPQTLPASSCHTCCSLSVLHGLIQISTSESRTFWGPSLWIPYTLLYFSSQHLSA